MISRTLLLAAALGLVLGAAPAVAEPWVVGLVPGPDAGVNRALELGARLALAEPREAGGPELELVLAAVPEGNWASSASGAVQLASRPRTLALIAPPDRSSAHLLATIATRAHVPLITTSSIASVTQTGSYWVASVVERADGADAAGEPQPPRPPDFDASAPAARGFVAAFVKLHGEPPGVWSVAGYDAARVVIEAVRQNEPSRKAVLNSIRSGEPIRGANGSFSFDQRGRRR